MKKVIFSLIFIFISLFSISQIVGGFYYGVDSYGNPCVYFKGTNISEYEIQIDISSVNELLNQEKRWNCSLYPDHSFTIGAEDQWYWQVGEKLIITYANGASRYWIFSPNSNNGNINFSNPYSDNINPDNDIMSPFQNNSDFYNPSVKDFYNPSMDEDIMSPFPENMPSLSDLNTIPNNSIFDNSNSKGKSKIQIEAEIQKCERNLRDAEQNLKRLQDRNESVTLWPQYQQIILKYKSMIENLQREKIYSK
jgi:hypothetical protein